MTERQRTPGWGVFRVGVPEDAQTPLQSAASGEFHGTRLFVAPIEEQQSGPLDQAGKQTARPGTPTELQGGK